MKKVMGLFAVVLFSVCCFASDLPVPEELIGPHTVGIIHIDMKSVKYDTLLKTATDKLGPLVEASALEPVKAFLEQFKAAGGEGVSLVINADKTTDPTNAQDGIVIVVNKGEEADAAKLTEILSQGGGKEQMAPDCPKKIGDALVWHTAKFKLPKASEERAKAFTETYGHLAKDSTVSIVIVPEADAASLAESAVKDAKPDEQAVVKALLGSSGLAVFTNMGAAVEPSLKVLIAAADEEGAGTIKKTASAVLAEIKKDAPPPIQAFIDTLKLVQAEASIQLDINLAEATKLVKEMMPPPPAK